MISPLPPRLWKSNSSAEGQNSPSNTPQQQSIAWTSAALYFRLLTPSCSAQTKHERDPELSAVEVNHPRALFGSFKLCPSFSDLLSACSLVMLCWGTRLVTRTWKLRISFSLWRTSWMTGLWVLNDSNPITSYGRAFELDIFINTNLFILSVCCLKKSLLVLTHV